jgi:predicted metal-binding protein
VPDSFEVDSSVSAPDARVGDAGVTIIVCSSCRFRDGPAIEPRPGLELARTTEAAAAGTGIAVKRVACLGNCRRGISAAMLRQGSWSYVFGELDTQSAGDLVKAARLFATSRDGFMPYSDRPESLKRGLIARIPSAINLEDLP